MNDVETKSHVTASGGKWWLTVASCSSRQPRLSSSFAPSSEHDYPKKMRLKKMCQHEQELAITPTPKEDKDLADLDVNLTLGLDLGYKIKVSCPFIVYWFRALAQQSGFDDLVAYVAEICLLAQLNDMKIAGNLKSSGSYSGSVKRKGVFNGTVKGDKVCQHGAKSIIVATKMHNAFCKYDMRRNVKASYRIHCRFQTWKIQREFFGMWGQAIRIQKSIIRWRQKRQLFRRLQVSQAEAEENPLCPEKEGFHKMIQKAQDHYRRMKPIHESS
uniref:Uncharacterized protein n=1 Tax=Brassica campestris TaxID=3711 RepID=A0A3P5Z0J6_BRACM|nr:unnamed protein product [Brassica rapa]